MPATVSIKRQSSVKSIPSDSEEYYTLTEIQDRLLAIYAEEENIFDESDVKKIVLSKRYLQRFAERRDGNVDKTVEMVKNTLIWRKEQKLPEITTDIIAKEFIALGAAFIHGTDVDGNLVLHVRAKYARVTNKTRQAIERLTAWTLFSIIEETLDKGKGWTLCADMTGISLAQYDLHGLMWALKVAVNYMPAGLKAVVIHNLPWFAKSLMKMVLAMTPSEWTQIIHFVGYKGLSKFIPMENLPNFYDNPNEIFVPELPFELKSIHEIDMSPLDCKREDLIEFFENTISKIK